MEGFGEQDGVGVHSDKDKRGASLLVTPHLTGSAMSYRPAREFMIVKPLVNLPLVLQLPRPFSTEPAAEPSEVF